MALTRTNVLSCLVSTFKTFTDVRRGLTRNVTVLGVPFEKGQGKPGVSRGPEVIRQAGLIEALKSAAPDIDVVDAGDVSFQPLDVPEVDNYRNLPHVGGCQKEVSCRVAEIVSSGQLCLTVGGDHSIAAGTIDGVVKATPPDGKLPVVLWVDAHADLNTKYTTPSGNAHGMPVTLLVAEISKSWSHQLPGMDWLVPRLSTKDFAYIGLRDVDVPERKFLEQYGMAAYSMEEVETHGVTTIVQTALRQIDPECNRPLHLSFDIDSLDALEAPSTGTPVRGGLSLREGLQIVELAHSTGRLVAFDLVEVNPELEGEADVRRTVQAALAICKAAVGYCRRGWPVCGLS